MTDAVPVRAEGRGSLAIRLAPFVTFLIALIGLLIWDQATTVAKPQPVAGAIPGSIISAIAFCVVALIASYGVKLLLHAEAASTPGVPQSYARDRIALYVVGAGTIGIVVTGIAAIVRTSGDSDTVRSIFTTVVPVFSTWVGTVLAAYFSNESFRQASTAMQATPASGPDTEPVTRGGTMIPFDRIIRYEMTADEVNVGKPILEAAAALPYAKLKALFKPPGVVRIVIFDDKRHPVYVLHHDATPADEKGTPDPAPANGQVDGQPDPPTLGTVLTGADEYAARNFSWTAASAQVADARRLFELRKVTDLFITQNGRSDEPVIGWVPDDNLRPATP